MTLLLMAAGRGSRYGALKQFDALGPNQEFLMEFSIYDALKCGFDHFVLVTQKTNVAFLKKYLTERLPQGIKIDVVAQTTSELPSNLSDYSEREKPWGTAHAVWCARHVINGPFVVINADDYYGVGAFEKITPQVQKNNTENRFSLLGYELQKTLSSHGSVSRGICEVGKDKYLIQVREHTKLEKTRNIIVDHETGDIFTGKELVSMNFWVCQPSIFEQIENAVRLFIGKGENLMTGEVYLPFVIQGMLEREEIEVEVVPANENWFGVTYSSDKQVAVNNLSEMSNEGIYPNPLWSNNSD